MKACSLFLALLLIPAAGLASVEVIRADAGNVLFRYVPGKASVQRGSGFPSAPACRVDFENADHLAEPGELDLPSKVVRVGIPRFGGVKVKVRTGPEQRLESVWLRTVPHVSWDGDSSWFQELPPDPGVLPRELVQVSPPEILRRSRFVQLQLSPCRYDVRAGALTSYEWLEVSVTFENHAGPRAPHRPMGDTEANVEEQAAETGLPARGRTQPDPLDHVVAGMFLNPEQAMEWRLAWPDRRPSQFDRSPNWVKIRVDSTGIYAISGRDLAAAGVHLSGLDPRTLALFTIGEHEPNRSYPDSMRAVPILVQGEEDGTIGPSDRVVFYGLAPEHWVGRDSVFVKNYFTRHNVYWLTWGGARGSRIPSGLGPDTAGSPVVHTGRNKLHQEKDLDCPARSGLLWIWTQLFKAADREVATLHVPLELSYPVQVVRLSGRLMASADGNRLSMLFNHRPVAAFEFQKSPPSGPFDFSAEETLPVNFSRNVLTFELRGNGEKRLYLDYLEVEYQRRLSLANGRLDFLADDTGKFRFCIRDARECPLVLDVTDPYAPRVSDSVEWMDDSARFCRRLTRPSAFALALPSCCLRPASLELRHPGRLRKSERQADYWVVTPKEYLGPAQQLARYRTSNVAGIVHAVADVAILDEIYDEYAFGMEEPGAIKRFFADKHPAYGLLAGDATCDYKGILGRRAPGVPTYEYGFGLNPDAYDRSALAFDAWYADFDGEGTSPDMILGRFTCRSAPELRQFVDKVMAYENQPAGIWNKRYLLLADDEFFGEADSTSNRRWDPIGFGHIAYCEATSQLAENQLDLVKVYLTEWPYVGVKNKPGAHAEFMRQMNLGGVVLVFFGHGAGFDLTHESVLNITQVPQIDNRRRSPFCYFGSCSVGRFDDTQFECIAEELVRQPGGAIASVGATKATQAGSNAVFARNLLTPLFTQPESTIGRSFYQAWPGDKIYHLFGDPATVLRLPRPSTQEIGVSPETLRPGGAFRINGLIEVPRAKFAWTLQGPRRARTYRSFRGETSYVLPGIVLARGTGDVVEGMLSGQGVFPLGVALDTVFVQNGRYAPLPRSSRVSLSAWHDSGDLAALRDSLPCAREAAPHTDTTGPTLALYANGQRLVDGASVPAKLLLDGVAHDQAGILIAPVPGATPRLYVNNPTYATDLSDLLLFDHNSTTTARFHLPLQLAGPLDSLYITMADNLLNLTTKVIAVRPLLSDVLRIESALVYPNPVRSDCVFTFQLTRQAEVRIRIYTLAGRLVRDLGASAAGFGYNQVAWDCRDRDGNSLANGVYLFILTAQSSDGPGREQRVSVRDKLLIRR